jgi:two-component system response regulator HupR/HoxA
VKQSIFYIDDEAQALDIFQQMFAGEYDVRTAINLAEARRMLSERPANIIISDQNMPEISGKEFLAEAARDFPQSYRVMLTGSMMAGDTIPEILSGIIHFFIPKPWTAQDMQTMLERADVYLKTRAGDTDL